MYLTKSKFLDRKALYYNYLSSMVNINKGLSNQELFISALNICYLPLIFPCLYTLYRVFKKNNGEN